MCLSLGAKSAIYEICYLFLDCARTAKSVHALTLAEDESCQNHEIHEETQIV
jgi:hypothetical protein